MSVGMPLASIISFMPSTVPLPLRSVNASSPVARASTVTRPLVGRSAWLVSTVVHTPPTVMQLGSTDPPSLVKDTAVPSGTGLWKWSANRAVSVVGTPSISAPSILKVETLSEKLSWEGMPVEMTSWSDCVERAPAVAVTRTAVATVPESTLVTTLPVAGSEVADAEDRDSPPTEVLRLKLTRVPPIGLPAMSTTRKVTRAVSDLPVPPVPFSVIMGGLVGGFVITDTN